MIRKCHKIPLEVFKDIVNAADKQYVELYIDDKNFDEILDFLSQYQSKTRSILYILLKGNYINELYGKENFSPDTKDLTALKYRLGKGKNFRIYCKEYFDEKIINMSRNSTQDKKVVLIELHNKKSNEFDKKLRNLLTKIARYEYEFEE